MSTTAIGDYALLSDRHSAALVSKDGSIDWLCFPRFDSPSVFARLLGEQAGHWSVRAAGASRGHPSLPGPRHGAGDDLPHGHGDSGRRRRAGRGRGQPGPRPGKGRAHVLLRQVACSSGEVEIELEYAPRPEYGLVAPLLGSVDGGLLATGGAAVMILSSRVPLAVEGSSASGRLVLRQAERAGFVLDHKKWADAEVARVWSEAEVAARLDDTVSAWQSWSRLHQADVGPWRDLVHHSGRVLQALSFQPTGAICAAATTSLPEVVGGARTWDYRYAWVRVRQ